MNKNLYSGENTLALKDSTKAYPLNTPSSILKWRYVTKDEKMVPLTSTSYIMLFMNAFS